MTQARHEYTLHTDGDGRVFGRAWTNDNLDRGEPSEEASWDVHYKSREQALKATGGSHFGINGCKVTVYIDGVELDRDGKAIPPASAPPRSRPSLRRSIISSGFSPLMLRVKVEPDSRKRLCGAIAS